MKKLIITTLAVFVLLGISFAQDNSITIDKGGEYGFAWTANTEPDLAGYRLYRSDVSGQYAYGAENAYAEFGLITESPRYSEPASGVYYFVLTAFDDEGMESWPSNEQTLSVVNEAPSAPSGCAIMKF